MHRLQRGCLMIGLLASLSLGSRPSEAQFTANFQTNTISSVTSNWTGDYVVGSNTFADTLLVQNGGMLTNWNGYLGYESTASNNTVLVNGTGSIWSNNSYLYIGYSGAGNSLVIRNGGQVLLNYGNTYAYLGYNSSSSNNSVLIADPGSIWNNPFIMGINGSGNSLVVSNGGQLVVGYNGYVDDGPTPGSGNAIVVTGLGSTWKAATIYFFSYGYANSLTIKNGGHVSSTDAFLGAELGGSNDTVSVADSGSVWSNTGAFYLGNVNNQMVISNGGQVVTSGIAYVGNYGTSNGVLVTGTAAIWDIQSNLYVGYFGGGNSLVISNGGAVYDHDGQIGSETNSPGNSVVVDGIGSVWSNSGSVFVGNVGSSSSLTVTGGSVLSTNLVIGYNSLSFNNVVRVDSGTLTVTNGTGTAILDVQRGQLIVNGGVLQADTLILSNRYASLVHTGGTLIVSNVVLDPNLFRIVSVTRQTNDLLINWLMGPGATNSLQAADGDGRGGYNTNSFTDIFVVTNNIAIGTATNYLDTGAVTNTTARYYRVRLAP